MTEFDDAAQLRVLCEKASKEYDGEKLIELVRKINELLDKTMGPKNSGEQASPSPVITPLFLAWGMLASVGLEARAKRADGGRTYLAFGAR